VNIISNGTGHLIQEKAFGLFIENTTPNNFLLIFGCGVVVNLQNSDIHLPVVVCRNENDEPYWIQPEGHFNYYWYQNVDISNNLSGELYVHNVSGLFIYNGLKECIYVYHTGHFKLINKC
jgi:hypothetical protein